jgi:three-Cys-motif partner protein
MERGQSFGGSWTEEKRSLLTKYLKAYITIFTSNPRARTFYTIYVDAFAGAGYIQQRQKAANQAELFEDLAAGDAQGFVKGSALRALDLTPGFKEYLFIEKDPDRSTELKSLSKQYRGKSISVKNVEANEYLRNWCAATDWKTTRALIFLDLMGCR